MVARDVDEVAKGLSEDADVLHVALAQALGVPAVAHGAAGKVHDEGRAVHPRLVYVLPPARAQSVSQHPVSTAPLRPHHCSGGREHDVH